MKKSDIKCSECDFCKEFRPWNNTRSNFYCEHPNQDYINKYFKEHKIRSSEGFLGYGKAWSHDVPLKTSPEWCPKKAELN